MIHIPNLKRVAAGLAFVLICCLLASATTFAQTPVQRKIDGIVAKIDNHIILRSEMEFTYLQYLAQSKQQDAPGLKCELLESMVQDKLLLARAEIDSVTVEESQVNGELNERVNYIVQQAGGVERVEQYYNKTLKQLKDDLRRSIKEQLVVAKMQRQIYEKVTVTPKEIRNYFNAIPKDSLPYFSSEVEIGQIVKFAQVSKQQKAVARQKLEDIKARIVAGEDFATLAKQFSDDVGSAQDGGELGFFKRKELVPEYEATALKLEPGQISNVVESQFGFHLIQLIEKRGQEFNSRHILIKPATATINVEEAVAEMDSIRNLIVNDSMTFAKAAKELSDDKNTKDNGGMLTNRATGDTYFPMEQVDPAIFFVIDTMKVGDISQPIPYKTPEGTDAVRIIYLKSKTVPHLANLRDDYQKISNAAIQEKRGKAVDTWFKKNLDTVYIQIDPEFQSCQILQSVNQ
ncbi:peptidylprolyl isomerase [Pontibacter qinzhouensis]|uniref:Peptidylprolyl isomerase n=1 Tax=Pontibacter qinzhouensis TaxID=2603253 RepID=A0A5C8K3T2_9BACT|nr:peptidylprolyl isomerase [Pontibacter qinzhouensis]TXK44924.1 peptidylprolyl isomerase [Pontibacter qinzhouensis]